MTEVRSQSCTACPYRRDVPSGVWECHEYEKLREYDEITPNQPFATFRCHVTPEHLCHGWVAVHMNRGHEYELIALRVWPVDGEIPDKDPSLFDSGNEAADHGQRDYGRPSRQARQTSQRLLRKYPRLRTG